MEPGRCECTFKHAFETKCRDHNHEGASLDWFTGGSAGIRNLYAGIVTPFSCNVRVRTDHLSWHGQGIAVEQSACLSVRHRARRRWPDEQLGSRRWRPKRTRAARLAERQSEAWGRDHGERKTSEGWSWWLDTNGYLRGQIGIYLWWGSRIEPSKWPTSATRLRRDSCDRHWAR